MGFKLSDKIWITRKSRIEAANRLAWNALWTEILIPYYSLFLVVVAAVDFRDKAIDHSFLLLIGSIMVLCVSILVSSSRFRERALVYKSCYIRLDGLREKAESIEGTHDKKNMELLDELAEEYREIQESTENHTDCDYLLAKFRLNNEPNFSLNRTEWVKLIAHRTLRSVVVLALFLLPVSALYNMQISYVDRGRIQTSVLR